METPCVVMPITLPPAYSHWPLQTRADGYWGELLEPRFRSVKIRGNAPRTALDPPLGQRLEDRLRPMTGEGGGDIRARLETPIGALAIRPRQIGRDGFAHKVVTLRVSEYRA